MKFHYKKIGLIILIVFVVLFVGNVKPAHAIFGYSVEDVSAFAISSAAQGIGYLVGFIGGIFFAISGYLIQFALNINFQLLKSPVVEAGWKIVLGFANLGFVLAIIVMAFATIFRVQSYAMKQTLWKLIVAALLVNFSLVIAGAFINISDIFSNYFLHQGGITNPVEWAKSFAGMFRAQALLEVSKNITATGAPNSAAGVINIFGTAVLLNVASIFFIALFTILAAITLFAVAVMLLIRYVYLGILLLLSPIIWLLWIFPSTKHLWSKWWQSFLRWTFFAPIMLFFIYLAMYSMKFQPDAVRQFAQNPEATANVNLTFGAEIIGEMAIVIALVMGGLIAANSLGIEFSKTAYGWAQGAGKGFGRWMGRETLEKTGGRIFSSKLFKGDAEKGKKGLTERLSSAKFPGVRFIGRGLNRLGLKTEETLQAGYGKLADRMTPDELNYEALSSRGSRRAVLLAKAAKRKDVDMDKLKALIFDPGRAKDIENEFNITGLNYNDFVKATGVNTDTVKYSAQVDEAKRTNNTTALVEAEKNLKEATAKLIKSIPLKDYSKGQWDDIFSKAPEAIKKALATGFAEYENGAYSKITPNIKGKNMDNYVTIIDDGITQMGMNPALAKKALEAHDRFHATLGRRAEFGEEAWTSGAGASATGGTNAT